MRKILLIVLIVLLLVGAGFTIANGFELGNFQIWGIKGISAQNKNIDNKNEELSGLVSVTYPKTFEELNTSLKTMTSTKQDYENKAILVSNSRYYMQTEKYEIEFLWTKLGNYAKDNNVQIKIDVVNNSNSKSGIYDLNFTIAGEYSKVTDFIYDVENDSKLGFKIEDFHMSANGNGVQGTFACKEINIKIETIDKDTEVSKDKENTTENTTTNNTTTNNTITNNTTTNNTTNTTENNAITEN